VWVGAEGELEVVEEVVSLEAASSSRSSNHVAFAVAEVVLEEGADMKYGYVQREAAGAMHFKSTLVQQVRGTGKGTTLGHMRIAGSVKKEEVGCSAWEVGCFPYFVTAWRNDLCKCPRLGVIRWKGGCAIFLILPHWDSRKTRMLKTHFLGLPLGN
jgi:hypothetical protein